MNKIGLFFYGSLNSSTGASTVLKNIVEGFVVSNEFLLEIYALDAKGTYKKKQIEPKKRKGIKFFLKEYTHFFLKKISKYSLLVASYYVYIQYHRNAKKVVNSNIQNVDSETKILFFHEILTPYYFKKKNKDLWHSKKKIVVLHSNGELFKMLFSYYPKLEKNKDTKMYYESEIALDVLKDVDKIVLLSEHAKNNFIKKYPFFSEKAAVVANGLKSKNKFIYNNKSNSKFIFTTVGTVCKRKGHDVLIDALIGMTNKERELFTLNVVGDGDLLNELKSVCKKKEINNVNFLGNRNDVDSILEKSDCFLLPSRDEGLPMAIIEAMSYGLPIISTEVGGIPDLVKNEFNGFLIEPNNSIKLKEAMLEVVTKGKSIEIGENSYKLFVEKYSIENMIKGYSNLFKNIYE